MTDGLIIKQPYADQIMNREKVVEYRVRKLPEDKYFIDIYILSQGHILGTANFDRCSENDNGFSWHIRRVNKLPQPLKYIHPKGARVWIREVVKADVVQKT